MKKRFMTGICIVILLTITGCNFIPNSINYPENTDGNKELTMKVTGYELASQFDLTSDGYWVVKPKDPSRMQVCKLYLEVTNNTSSSISLYSNIYMYDFYLTDGNNRFTVSGQSYTSLDYGLPGKTIYYNETVRGFVYVVVPKNFDINKCTLNYEYSYMSGNYDDISININNL